MTRAGASIGTGAAVAPVGPTRGLFSDVFGSEGPPLCLVANTMWRVLWYVVSMPWASSVFHWVHHSLAASRAGFGCCAFIF